MYTMPKMSGEIIATNFEVGDTVKAGDVLCEISDESIQPQIDQAQAGVSLAQTNVDMVNGGSTQQQINQLKASLESAKITLDDAGADLAENPRVVSCGSGFSAEFRAGAKRLRHGKAAV